MCLLFRPATISSSLSEKIRPDSNLFAGGISILHLDENAEKDIDNGQARCGSAAPGTSHGNTRVRSVRGSARCRTAHRIQRRSCETPTWLIAAIAFVFTPERGAPRMSERSPASVMRRSAMGAEWANSRWTGQRGGRAGIAGETALRYRHKRRNVQLANDSGRSF
jgi:hypothetical protein